MSHTETTIQVPLDRTAPVGGRPRELTGRLRRAVGVVLAAGLLSAAVLVGSSLGLDLVLRIAGIVALVLVGLGVAAVGAAAVVVRRRLAELRHLPDLGRRFVTSHERAAVHAVALDEAGNLAFEVASQARQTMVFDEAGSPDHVTLGGAVVTRRTVPAASGHVGEAFQRLNAIAARGAGVTLVQEGIIGLAGPVATAWRLEAEGGLVITGRG